MRIKCTIYQKEALINALSRESVRECLFMKNKDIKCPTIFNREKRCRRCLENNIKWKIIDKGDKKNGKINY